MLEIKEKCNRKGLQDRGSLAFWFLGDMTSCVFAVLLTSRKMENRLKRERPFIAGITQVMERNNL